MQTINLPDAAATKTLGAKIAAALPERTGGLMLLLRGDLGAGKSTLARALVHALGHAGAVPSPTYTLVEPYDLAGGPVYHIDLYRVHDIEELEYLGWQDLRDGLMLIEWPERVEQLERESDLLISLDFVDSGRRAKLQSLSARGSALLQGLSDQDSQADP